MKDKSKLLPVILGFALILAFIFGGYFAIKQILLLFNSLNSELSKVILTASFTIFGAVLTHTLGKYFEQKIRIQQEIREKKILIYEEHIKLIFKVLFAAKNGEKAPSELEISKAFSGFTEKLIMWGGPDVIKSWQEFRSHPWSNDKSLQGFLKFEKVILSLRKELGNSKGSLSEGDFLRLFINDYDEVINSK